MARGVEQRTGASAHALRSSAFVLKSSNVSCVRNAGYVHDDALFDAVAVRGKPW